MARLRHRGGTLVIHLNPIERIAALRRDVVVPLSSIVSVDVIERPLTPPGVLDDLKLGFAALGAPAQRLATIGAWDLRDNDGKALVVDRDVDRSPLTPRTGAGSSRVTALP